MSTETHEAVFAALGDETRQRLLALLAAEQQASAAALAEPLSITRQAVEKQLAILVRADLVAVRRDGRRVSYSVQSRTLHRSAAWLHDLAAAWDRRLLAVKEAAEREP